uniref:Uncharacterized protein n=1 Tax=Anguilla anguilla TaxID=7936 RepID=A0A0E9SUS6_ANGAN
MGYYIEHLKKKDNNLNLY